MSLVELAFPLYGTTIPENNGYLLYSAISRTLDAHLLEGVALLSVGGTPIGEWRMRLEPNSRLRLRLPADRIGEILPLAGKFLDLDGHELGLGIPEIRAVEPAGTLSSRLVTIKGFTEPASFLDAAGRQLQSLGVAGELDIPTIQDGPRSGLPVRRVIRVKGKQIVGFALRVAGLGAEDSLTLLQHGLGGRRRMGCGVFVPVPAMAGGMR